MVERLLVTVIVILAACYALWRLWPARSRLLWLRRLDGRARGVAGGLIHRLRLRAEAATGCDACAEADRGPRR
jgi:hypothetical protein